MFFPLKVTMEKAPERKRQSKSQLSRRESNPQNTFYSTLKDTSIICITIHLRRVHWKLDTFGICEKGKKTPQLSSQVQLMDVSQEKLKLYVKRQCQGQTNYMSLQCWASSTVSRRPVVYKISYEQTKWWLCVLCIGVGWKAYQNFSQRDLRERDDEYMNTLEQNLNHDLVKEIHLFYTDDNSMQVSWLYFRWVDTWIKVSWHVNAGE